MVSLTLGRKTVFAAARPNLSFFTDDRMVNPQACGLFRFAQKNTRTFRQLWSRLGLFG
jgi:hypothetical protein